MKRKLVATLTFLLLSGCSFGFNASVMKQWDRPAERVITEDVIRTNQPRVEIKTQDSIRIDSGIAPAPVEEPVQPEPTPKMKPMSHEVPQIIVPQTKGIQYMYLHQHDDEKHTCYVRKAVGTYAMKGE